MTPLSLLLQGAYGVRRSESAVKPAHSKGPSAFVRRICCARLVSRWASLLGSGSGVVALRRTADHRTKGRAPPPGGQEEGAGLRYSILPGPCHACGVSEAGLSADSCSHDGRHGQRGLLDQSGDAFNSFRPAVCCEQATPVASRLSCRGRLSAVVARCGPSLGLQPPASLRHFRGDVTYEYYRVSPRIDRCARHRSVRYAPVPLRGGSRWIAHE